MDKIDIRFISAKTVTRRPDIKDTCKSPAKTIINCIAIALAIYNIADTWCDRQQTFLIFHSRYNGHIESIFTQGTVVPGTFAPGTFRPGIFEPGTVTPGTFRPGIFEPQTVRRRTFRPGTFGSGTVLLKTFRPVSFAPETVRLGTFAPGTVRQGTIAPGTVSQTLLIFFLFLGEATLFKKTPRFRYF